MDRQVLLHCIQRERGATCAWVASGGAHFRETMMEWRGKANEELERGQLRVESLPRDLAQLRALADSRTQGTGNAANFYAVFSAFNRICNSLVPRAVQHRALEEFARLKEATGVERAFLCGVLSLPAEEVAALPPRAFADFVLCVHAQRAHAASLREKAAKEMENPYLKGDALVDEQDTA